MFEVSSLRVALAWLAVSSSSGLAHAAGAGVKSEDKLDCPSASEEGQRLRDQKKLRDARGLFQRCAASSCPAIVRRDCSVWLSEVESSMPTVVVAVVDENDIDITDAEVAIDGEIVSTKLDGSAIEVDPGPHEFRATASGRMPATVPVVARVGERNRIVRIKFARKLGNAAASTSAPEPRPAPTSVPLPSPYTPPVLSVVLGGVGLLGLGAFAALGISGKSELTFLRETCAPNCDEDALASTRRRLIAADISLLTGVLALGAGATLWIVKATKASTHTAGGSRSTLRAVAAPTAGGVAAGVHGTF